MHTSEEMENEKTFEEEKPLVTNAAEGSHKEQEYLKAKEARERKMLKWVSKSNHNFYFPTNSK